MDIGLVNKSNKILVFLFNVFNLYTRLVEIVFDRKVVRLSIMFQLRNIQADSNIKNHDYDTKFRNKTN